MSPHTRFKLAVIRTMRCDFCNKSNVDGLQECVDCNMHICRQCVETGKLNNDERHRMQQNAIDNLNWSKPPRNQRATHRRAPTVSESVAPAVLSKQERRQARDERHLLRHPHHGAETHHESPVQFRRIFPNIQQNVETFPGPGFNVSAGNHEHAGHGPGPGHYQYFSTLPGYPPGHAPPLPTHATPYGVPSSGPGQHGQQPSQGGFAMPLGPIHGHQFSVNPGFPPRGDPRYHTPPGQQFAYSGYPVPNNCGIYYEGQPLAYSPAPTPPGFAGPGFHQHISQPPPMYNDRGYVPRGNMATGQPVPGPGHFTVHLHGGGPFPHAPPPPQEQRRPYGQEGESTQGGQTSHPAELAREARAHELMPHEHAERPVDPSSIEQKQQQQQAWEREQAQQEWEQQQARQEWERQQGQPAFQHPWEQSQQQPMQQDAQQPVAQQQQSQERQQHQTQPAVEQASQTAQQVQKQNDQRQEQPEEQQPKQQQQQQAAHLILKSDPVSGAFVITDSGMNGPSLTLPPITAPPFTASSVQEVQAPDSAPVPRLPTLEPDPNSQLSRLQLSEAYSTPSVVDHTQRPFGIPALARDLYAGRPNHYDETAARWAHFQSAYPQRSRQGDDEEEYNYETDSDTDGATITGTGSGSVNPGRPSDQPPNRGLKRPLSLISSGVDSTLSAELDQPAAAAAVSGTETLRRKLLDDVDIVRARREGGERAALDMAAAANTLQGGGRGLGGVTDAQVVANDREIRRRQEDVDRRNSGHHGEEKKKHRRGGVGGGGSSGSGGESRGRVVG